MNYLAHWLIGKLEDWHQCSPEVWRVLMAGGALLVTALLLPLWRLPSNEQRHARVLSEWGNLQFWDSTAWFPKIWGIWGPQRFSIRTCIISSPHIPRPYPPYPPYKGGHHVLLQTHFGKTEHPCCIASGDPEAANEDRAAATERFNGELFERVACDRRRETPSEGPKWFKWFKWFILELGQWNVWEPASVQYVACFLEL